MSPFLHYIPKNVSVCPYQATYSATILDALIRNNLYAFVQHFHLHLSVYLHTSIV